MFLVGAAVVAMDALQRRQQRRALLVACFHLALLCTVRASHVVLYGVYCVVTKSIDVRHHWRHGIVWPPRWSLLVQARSWRLQPFTLGGQAFERRVYSIYKKHCSCPFDVMCYNELALGSNHVATAVDTRSSFSRTRMSTHTHTSVTAAYNMQTTAATPAIAMSKALTRLVTPPLGVTGTTMFTGAGAGASTITGSRVMSASTS